MSTEKIILVTGATGLVGRALCVRLLEKGYVVRTLGRGASSDFSWDLDSGSMDPAVLEGVDCVVHLAGETVAQRWTKKAKQRIMDSRVKSTKLLVDTILKQGISPDFICASGSSFYGFDCGYGADEDSASGDGFLAEVCRAWEGAAEPLTDAEVRTVFARTGIVLSVAGGALAKMLPPFKAGLGGRMGSGRQWMSWITLTDLVEVYIHLIENASLVGAVNAVVPEPVTNREFTQLFGQALKRPTLFPMPEFSINLLFGEMGKETVLADVGILPKRLTESGFAWQTTELSAALSECLS